MTESTEGCIGCGAIVARVDGPTHRYMTSAPGCWELYGEVCAHHLSDPNGASYRQLCVDAYAVQHPGQPGPQATQSVGVHLISLLCQFELDLPPARASALMTRGTLSKGSSFTWLAPPSFDDAHTVQFMHANLDRAPSAAREWAESAWRAWSAHHRHVRLWYDELQQRRDR